MIITTAAGAASSARHAVALARRAIRHTTITHRAAATSLEQARVLRYWTADRMVRARPPGRSMTMVTAIPADVGGPVPSQLVGLAKRGTTAVRSETSAADWPGGGTVARTTGKVFFTMGGQDFVCSAASVTSANANVVITAAHCVKNGAGHWAANWTFVPGYADGSRPYGTWTASRFFVSTGWTRSGNENDDVAFVTLNPHRTAGGSASIGQVVGGEDIAFGWRPAQAYAFGFPAEAPYDGTALYYCSGRVTADPYHASADAGLNCDLTAGSSGGPWLSDFDPASGTGTITSVSSFKYDTDEATLYGPRLGALARVLFNQAQHS
jgi:V8-like Glu-specific endopeptidase